MRLLRIQKPDQNGLCHPDLYSIRDCIEEKRNNCIFIANTQVGSGYHWIVITNKNCLNKHWRVFDGLFMDIKNYVEIFKTILPGIDKILITRENIPKQTDSKSCGLIAMANVYALAFDQNPVEIEWITTKNKMRDHFRSIISTAIVSQFPSKEIKPKRKLEEKYLLLK